MKNLKVWQKLALMGLIFLIPLALVTYKMASLIDELRVGAAQQEALGLEYYVAQRTLLKDLQQHRGMNNAFLGGDTSFKDSLAQKRADLDNDLESMNAVDRQQDAALHTSANWNALNVRCRELLSRASGLSAEESFAQHTRLINDLITMMRDVGDASGLVLDPDLDSYYLMTVVVFHGPELGENLAQARGLGSRVAASKHLSPDQAEALNRMLSLAGFLQLNVEEALGKAFKFNAALRPALETQGHASAKAIKDAGVLTKTLIAQQGAGISASDFFSAMTLSIEVLSSMQDQAVAALKEVLERRIARYRSELRHTLGAALLGLLAATIIGFLIMRDIVRPLGDVVKVANRIADGDLAVRLALEGRKDEIGLLAQTFKRMADELVKTVGQVQKSAIQVNTSVMEISATAKEQQATVSEVAATTSEIGATSKEISATSKELVKTVGEVATVAEQTATLAGNGQAGLARMEETMQRVMEAAGSINTKLAVLSEKAGNINQVVTTITKVADQTNLLSLNAAIEAEKAGEYGRGFAVVATEIRRLADQTAVATYDIGQMVREIQSAVSAGVMGMDRFSEQVRHGMQEVQQAGEQLSQIIHQVQSLAPRFEAVNEGMQAQATGAEQISDALTQLSEVSQQTVDSLRQSTEAISELNQVVSGLRSSVAYFKLHE